MPNTISLLMSGVSFRNRLFSLWWLCLIGSLLSCGVSLSGQALSKSLPSNPGAQDLGRLHRLLQSPKPITWVFTGDSVTQGAKWAGDYRPYPDIVSERIRWELKRSRDIVVNTAISGSRARDILHDFNWRVAHLHPDVVSLMVGMNDCVGGKQQEESFQANLEELVRRIRLIGAIPVLHTTNTTLHDKDRTDLPRYNIIIRRVAVSESVILVDNWSQWQENRTSGNLNAWLGNSIHPNGLGHIQIAQEMLRTLEIFDATSDVGRYGLEVRCRENSTAR